MNNDYFNEYEVIKKKRSKRYRVYIIVDEDEDSNQRKINLLEEWIQNQKRINEFNEKTMKSRRDFEVSIKQLKEHVNGKHTELYDNIQSLKKEVFTASKNREEGFKHFQNMKK